MNKIIKNIFILSIVLATVNPLQAQLNPMKSQYFQNAYLVNPAMAGVNGKSVLYANYSNQWNKIDGAPVLMSLSATQRLNEKAAVGINIINDKSGILAKTQAMGSFAYKVPFSDDHNLRFGVSLSWSQDRIGVGSASASGANDVELAKYNDREDYLDGNFGVSYHLKGFEGQFSYLSLNQKKSGRIATVNYSTFYSAVSYNIDFDPLFGVKPLIAYRGIKGYDNQFDFAAEWRADMLRFYTMYHSNKSFTAGIGYIDKSNFNFSLLYNSEPSALRSFSGGIFDVIVGYKF